tara:strand:+ start:401 stop:1522 length:1122 start_codon:yes stop_codon:yes gene_type:complete
MLPPDVGSRGGAVDNIFIKDTQELVERPGALETPFHEQDTFYTPNDRFFVCNVTTTPRVDPASWSLTIAGDAVATPLTLSLDGLTDFERVELDVLMECAGNQRQLFEEILKTPLDKRPHLVELRWMLGGVGMARWRGIRLRDVLERAGIMDDAYHVLPFGSDPSDEEPDGTCIPMPAAKALHPDTLIALAMNGEALPADHGFPARLVVPGWVGTYSVKWLRRIEVTREHRWVSRNTKRYVMMGDAWDGQDWGPANGPNITEHPVRSSLTLPWPAALAPGRHRIAGYARGGEEPIAAVVWSGDGGATWHDAQLDITPARYAWAPFSFDWDATPGEHTLMTRATDAAGRTQPMEQPFNNGGYIFHMVHPHPVAVG